VPSVLSGALKLEIKKKSIIKETRKKVVRVRLGEKVNLFLGRVKIILILQSKIFSTGKIGEFN